MPESAGAEASQVRAMFHGAVTATLAYSDVGTTGACLPSGGEALRILVGKAKEKIASKLTSAGLPVAPILYKLLSFPAVHSSVFGLFIIADMPAATGYCFFCSETVSEEIGKDLFPAGTNLPFGVDGTLFKNLIPRTNEQMIIAAHEGVRSSAPTVAAAWNALKTACEEGALHDIKMAKAEAFAKTYNEAITLLTLTELRSA